MYLDMPVNKHTLNCKQHGGIEKYYINKLSHTRELIYNEQTA